MHQTSYCHGDSPAEVIDQLQHHSFMPSPPYTPYNSPPALGDIQQFPPSTIAYESNDSPYSVNAYSYKMQHSLSLSENGCQYGNTSPPYSATSIPQTLPLAGGVASTPQQSQTPACFQQPGPFIYIAPNGFVPSSVVDSMIPPHVAAMSVGTLNPSVEMPATFYTHGLTVTFQSANSFGDPPFTDLSTCISLVILRYWAPTIA